jgi:hypothetical protein
MPKGKIPKTVERYVAEHEDDGLDPSYAWALAWSRYCQFKQPGSPHCKQEGGYFPNRPELRKSSVRTAADDDEPTDSKLWEQVKEMARGERDSLRGMNAPNEGKGFAIWPSAYAVGWCLKTYKDLGGGWRKKKSSGVRLPPEHHRWARALSSDAFKLGSQTAAPRVSFHVTASSVLCLWQAEVALPPRSRRIASNLASGTMRALCSCSVSPSRA